MTDLHCHIVPGVDDGPPTMEDSLALCRAASDAGTTMIIATPHINWHYPAVDAAVVQAGVAAVNAAVTAAALTVKVRAGAEIALPVFQTNPRLLRRLLDAGMLCCKDRLLHVPIARGDRLRRCGSYTAASREA